MAPVEWPLADRSDGQAEKSTRRVEGDRLSAVRADFFLDPGARLTEQERAMMTAMLSDLVAVLADEIRAEGGLAGGRSGDNGEALFDRLRSSGLLDIPELVEVLLRRAEQERVAEAIRGRGRDGAPRFLHGLAGRGDPEVSVAAMAVILGRSRRRDRFDSPRIDFDDVPAEAARPLVHSVAAALRDEAPPPDGDRKLCDAAAALLSRHDEGKRTEALSFALVHALDVAGQLDEDALLAAFAEGEVALVAEALARRAGVDCETAWSHFVGGDRSLARLLRMAGVTRTFAATIAATVGDSIAGAATAIGRFDSILDEEVERSRARLRLDRSYRDAIVALGGSDG